MKKNVLKGSVNVYQMVTDRIVNQLEKGLIPWRMPWHGLSVLDGGAINYVTRKPYSLLNQMLLGKEGEYLTFNQIKERGGRIKKGAKAGIIVFYSTVTFKKRQEEKVNEETGEKEIETINVVEEKLIPVLKYYNVFHIDDVEGIETKIKADQPVKELHPIETAEKVINDYISRENGLKFINNKPSNRAYFSPSQDLVNVPMLSQYDIPEEYYSTTFHELTHSTMISCRCNRQNEGKIAAFGDENYSREELVAEIGSAMLCNRVGIDCEKAFNNSVAYIQGWLRALKNDNKFIVWAASRAEKAAKYILNEKEA